MISESKLDALIEKQGALVLDGGLATELENRGYDLDHDLWSARLLLSNPDAICEVHRSYLKAGARCLITASYQASLPGLVAQGLAEAKAKELLASSVSIARQACDLYCDQHPDQEAGGSLLVAGSIGPYGAYLADGSEYRGNYGISRQHLKSFHAPRLATISQAGPDLLACETIPCRVEAMVLMELIEETTDAMAWFSFSCRDDQHISDGTPLIECAAMLDDCPQICAVGINCTAPQYIISLIEKVRIAAPSKHIVVYPNSGETYDGQRRIWVGQSDVSDFGAMAKTWYDAGATLIGGCCRTGPSHISAIRDAIQSDSIA